MTLCCHQTCFQASWSLRHPVHDVFGLITHVIQSVVTLNFFFFLDMTGSEWEREMEGGNGKGPRGGIRSRDTQRGTMPYVGAVPEGYQH